MRKHADFEWTTKCEDAFESMKKTLATPQVLTKQLLGETLHLYLVVVVEDVSGALSKELDSGQSPVYFVSNALAEAETRYQKIEKATFVLVKTS